MTKSARTVRSLLCTLVSFLMSLFVVLTVLCLTLSATVLNPAFAVRVLARSQFSEALCGELREEFVSYGNACNIDESFFDGVFGTDITPESIDADASAALRRFYAGSVERDPAVTEALQSALLTKLQAYAVEQGFTLDDTVNENLQTIASELCTLYDAYAGVFSASYFATAAQLLARYSPYALYAAAAGAAGFAVCAVILRLFFTKRRSCLRFFIYAFSASALMLAAAPAAGLALGAADRVNISLLSLYDFVTGFLNAAMLSVLLSALVPALVTALLALARRSGKAPKAEAEPPQPEGRRESGG